MFIKRNNIQISPQEYQALLRRDFYSLSLQKLVHGCASVIRRPNWAAFF